MYKDTRTFEQSLTAEQWDLLQSPGGALKALRENFASDDLADLHQPLCQPDPVVYQRLTLRDGSTHWLVMFANGDSDGWVAAIAAHPTTGLFYRLVAPFAEIVRIEEFPTEIIEQMPEEIRPYGFADHPVVQNGDY